MCCLTDCLVYCSWTIHGTGEVGGSVQPWHGTPTTAGSFASSPLCSAVLRKEALLCAFMAKKERKQRETANEFTSIHLIAGLPPPPFAAMAA